MAEQDNSSSSFMWKSILGAVLLMVLIVPFAMRDRSVANPAADAEAAEARIAAVARFELTKAVAQSGPRTPEQVYTAVCAACHGTGAAGAPKKGDKAAWAPRLAQGIDGLLKSAIAGKGAMPPRGGAADLSDAELKAVIEYVTK